MYIINVHMITRNTHTHTKISGTMGITLEGVHLGTNGNLSNILSHGQQRRPFVPLHINNRKGRHSTVYECGTAGAAPGSGLRQGTAGSNLIVAKQK